MVWHRLSILLEFSNNLSCVPLCSIEGWTKRRRHPRDTYDIPTDSYHPVDRCANILLIRTYPREVVRTPWRHCWVQLVVHRVGTQTDLCCSDTIPCRTLCKNQALMRCPLCPDHNQDRQRLRLYRLWCPIYIACTFWRPKSPSASLAGTTDTFLYSCLCRSRSCTASILYCPFQTFSHSGKHHMVFYDFCPC